MPRRRSTAGTRSSAQRNQEPGRPEGMPPRSCQSPARFESPLCRAVGACDECIIESRDMSESSLLRKQLIELLKGRGAHADFDAAVAGFPVARAGDTPPGVEHSAWQLLEHLRIAQWDIL